jgi:hypothetical protein
MMRASAAKRSAARCCAAALSAIALSAAAFSQPPSAALFRCLLCGHCFRCSLLLGCYLAASCWAAATLPLLVELACWAASWAAATLAACEPLSYLNLPFNSGFVNITPVQSHPLGRRMLCKQAHLARDGEEVEQAFVEQYT